MEAATRGHIEVDHVSLAFAGGGGTIDAVREVSITVNPGEFVSLIGPSGCGKSSLLNMVAGFVKAGSGVVRIDGAPVERPGGDKGMVFQQYSLFPWMTVRKNVEFGLKMKGVGAGEREAAARTLLGLAGLLSFENHYPDQLSGGMKQRVGIVRALATGPTVLLLDEPFGALDAQTRLIMQEILTNMWQKLCISVLFVTHDIDEAIFLSDRVYVMTSRPGQIKAEILVPLPRPRPPAVMMEPAFHRLRGEVMQLIREESLKALGRELGEGGTSGFGIDTAGRSVADMI